MLKLKVNDIDVEVEEGTTVLQACRKVHDLKDESKEIKEDFSNLIRTLSSYYYYHCYCCCGLSPPPNHHRTKHQASLHNLNILHHVV